MFTSIYRSIDRSTDRKTDRPKKESLGKKVEKKTDLWFNEQQQFWLQKQFRGIKSSVPFK